MGYVEKLLAPGETVIHSTRRHWIVLLRWVGSALLLAVLGAVMATLFAVNVERTIGPAAWVGIALFAVGALVALPGWLRWRNELYLVTNRRVIHVAGVFTKRVLDSGVLKVNDVRLVQHLTGRLLGYGTLEIITASESGINRLDYLPQPLMFKKMMMAASGAGRDDSGSHHPAAGVGAPPAQASRVVAAAAAQVPSPGPAVVATPAATPAPAASPPPRSAADRLADLEELRRRGLVSEDEYRVKREEIVRAL